MVTCEVPKRAGERIDRDAPFRAQELADAPSALLDQQAAFGRVQHQTGIASSTREPSNATCSAAVAAGDFPEFAIVEVVAHTIARRR